MAPGPSESILPGSSLLAGMDSGSQSESSSSSSDLEMGRVMSGHTFNIGDYSNLLTAASESVNPSSTTSKAVTGAGLLMSESWPLSFFKFVHLFIA